MQGRNAMGKSKGAKLRERRFLFALLGGRGGTK